jgi:hypothetical protein
MSVINTSFELDDGRVLSCEYALVIYRGSLWNPEEVSVSEPIYRLDGDLISVDSLPKGLERIANRLYMAGPGEYKYKEMDNYRGVTEPDEPEYLF